MPCVQYESGDVPTHDEYPDRQSHQAGSERIYAVHVFRCQEERTGAEGFKKQTADRGKEDIPKDEKYLVSPEVKEKQLYRQGIKKTGEILLHKQSKDTINIITSGYKTAATSKKL